MAKKNTNAQSKKLWKIGMEDFNTDHFDFNKDGDLIIKEGNNIYNVQYLAEKLGSPIEILCPFIVEERLEDLLDITKSIIKKNKYQGKFYYHYPMKVNQNKEVVLALVGEGAHMETSSYNDLWLIKKMMERETFNPKMRVLCSGPKTNEYMNLIDDLQHKGLKVIPLIEGPNELKFLQQSRYDVGIRLDMPIKAESHWNKKIDRFGFSAKEILEMDTFKNLKILHYHIGSQIEKPADIVNTVKYALGVYFKLKKKNPSLDTLDIGGGMPIPYTRDKKFPVDKIMERIIKLMKDEADRAGMAHPNLICEWGRYVVAPAQISVFKIIDDKRIKPKKASADRWYVIDGSFMNDLPDTWTIGQKWAVAPASKVGDEKLANVWLAGSSCDSDDIYTGYDGVIELPDYEYGEKDYFIVMFDTGAYQDPLAARHCLLSSPIKVIAENGHVVIAREKESPEEIGKDFGW